MLERLQKVLNGIDHPITSDFLAIDIKQALYHLGEITGSISTDDLLDNIELTESTDYIWNSTELSLTSSPLSDKKLLIIE